MTISWHLLERASPLVQGGLLPAFPIAQALKAPTTDPVAIFLVILAIMLVAPLLVERLRLPGIIGLILAGVIVGPYGLGVLERDSTIELLSTVGLLFLMFLGGLETSLDDLKKNADKPIIFGLSTFVFPMLIGTGGMVLLGYGFWPSVLVASCFASHTLVALPVLSKLGIMRHPATTAALGGTLITNVLALLVLAVVVKADQGNLTLGFWLFLIPSLAIYTFAVLWGIPRLGRWFFKTFGQDDSAEFTFVLAALFVASYLAGLIEIEPIVGAFLAGISITQIIPRLSPLMNRIQFIGNTLFVPIFLISVGMLVDPLILIREPQSILFAALVVILELASKLIAAWVAAWWFKWPLPSTMVMFGLSVAQAASTLAAITIAFDIGLVDELVVNAIILMILVSCVLSPWVVARWGPHVQLQTADDGAGMGGPGVDSPQVVLGMRVLVPVANPSTEDNLLRLALILTQRVKGTLLPLHVWPDNNSTAISPSARQTQARLLDTAEAIANAASTPVETIARIDNSIDWGIIRAAQERDADLLICGWKGFSTYRENFFGSVIDNIVRSATIPVLITRFPQPIQNTRRIVLAITGQQATLMEIRAALLLAHSLSEELKAPLEAMYISVNRRRRSKLIALLEKRAIPTREVEGNSARLIAETLQPDDLLVLIESTHRMGQPALGREPEAIARANWDNNMIIVHFPTLKPSDAAAS